MEQNIQAIIDLVTGNSNLSAEEKAAVISKLKETDKKISITEFKLDRTEKVKRTTAILLEETITELEQKRKAVEAQNRELEIESSLERVRTVALSMNKPDDMLRVCRVISEQLQYLHLLEIRNVQTAIFYETKGTYINYEFYAKHDETLITEVDYKNHPVQSGFADQMLKGPNEIFIHSFNGKEVQDWYKFQATTNVFLDTYLETAGSLNYYWYSLGPVALGISTYKPLGEGETNLFKRFVKVFELSYRRYLDIELAMVQAREAQIELALERVRARTMAMQKSEELAETSFVLFQQFKDLGETSEQISIGIFNDDEHVMELYSTLYGLQWKEAAKVDLNEPVVMKKIHKAWNEQKKSLVIDLAGDDLREYNAYRKKLSNLEYREDRWVIHIAFFSKGALTFSTTQPQPHETIQLLERFAGVFDGTYTRFLDLHKAETQAREAQIEVALEKVRSRSLAVHKSDEFTEVIKVIFERLQELGFQATSVSINTFIKDSNDTEVYICGQSDNGKVISDFRLPYFNSLISNDRLAAQKNNVDFFSKTYNSEEKNLFYDLAFELSDLKLVPDEIKKMVYDSERYTISLALAKNSMIVVNDFAGNVLLEDEIDIIKRFARVFEQAYIRFLDLQKVEAQARESQIEAALERVRSRSMGMQKSEELRDVMQVIFEQFIHLSFYIDLAGFIVDYKESDVFNIWAADPYHEFPTKIHIPYFDHPLFKRFKEAKENGIDFYSVNLSFEEKNRYFDHAVQYIPDITRETKQWLYNCAGMAVSNVLLKNVVLFIQNNSGIPFSEADNATLIRFGKVFEQSYTRFKDLKQAEAQALEVIKRASVDRVRAEIASMRTTSDLERITPLIWNELTTLGVPFVRCGVFIMDEETQEVQTMLSTPDGKSIGAFRQPYNTPGEIAQIIEHWHKKKMYKQHWNEAQFVEFTKNLVEQGAITSGEKYLTENRPSNLYLHFLPFLQGMLYAGSETPLNEDELQLVQNLADAFSTAYARYEDFNKLESANIKIEKTLVDLKQTQAQLVQSEKMASLGELTAGIAHEIQNPLNFVNNFSELNKELLGELNEEIEKGNYDEVKIIANDVIGNEEKISHHGRRADAIVKGMLQHSRTSGGQKEPTDINVLADEYLRLAYHGLRAKDKSFNATVKTNYDSTLEKINVIPQDIGRVILNLITNAFYAIHEKAKQHTPDPDALPPGQPGYEPTISVSTKKPDNKVFISVKDNGGGIPERVVDKIFQPFFTTKPTGQGTGLGLSLSYDIMKAHGGEIKVETKEGEGSEFIISLPV